MKKTVEIVEYSQERDYLKKNGEVGYGRNVVVQWMEEGLNGRFEQSTVLEVDGRLDEKMLLQAKQNRTLIEVTIYFQHTEWQGKYYPRIRGYFPAEYRNQEDNK